MFAMIVTTINMIIEKTKYDDNNGEGAVLEQDNIWEQSQVGAVQHGKQQVLDYLSIIGIGVFCSTSDMALSLLQLT